MLFLCGFIMLCSSCFVRSCCLEFLGSVFRARLSSVTSDLEISVRFYARHGFVAMFRQLLVAKPDPGSFVEGKGGNSAAFRNAEVELGVQIG